MIAVLPALARPLVEPHLPDGIEARWYMSLDEARALAADADIGWLDHNDPREWAANVAAAPGLKWLSTIYAGLDALDTETLRSRGTRVTNGSGVNAFIVPGIYYSPKQFTGACGS